MASGSVRGFFCSGSRLKVWEAYGCKRPEKSTHFQCPQGLAGAVTDKGDKSDHEEESAVER